MKLTLHRTLLQKARPNKSWLFQAIKPRLSSFLPLALYSFEEELHHFPLKHSLIDLKEGPSLRQQLGN